MTSRSNKPQPPRAQRMLLMMAVLLALCHVAACMRTGKSMSTQLRGGGGGRALLQAMVEATTATFHDAPACLWRPNAGSSSPDAAGRLWGWESGQSCAFRSGAGRPLFYTGYEPGSWVLTPTCRSAPFAPDAVTVRGCVYVEAGIVCLVHAACGHGHGHGMAWHKQKQTPPPPLHAQHDLTTGLALQDLGVGGRQAVRLQGRPAAAGAVHQDAHARRLGGCVCVHQPADARDGGARQAQPPVGLGALPVRSSKAAFGRLPFVAV
jgi:hypothetical protein